MNISWILISLQASPFCLFILKDCPPGPQTPQTRPSLFSAELDGSKHYRATKEMFPTPPDPFPAGYHVDCNTITADRRMKMHWTIIDIMASCVEVDQIESCLTRPTLVFPLIQPVSFFIFLYYIFWLKGTICIKFSTYNCDFFMKFIFLIVCLVFLKNFGTRSSR